MDTKEADTKDCEFLDGCPIFARFKLEGMKNLWIQLYCKGPRQDTCARKRLKREGQEVPETLLPSGDHLDTLSK